MRRWTARLAGVAASQMLLVALGWEMYALTGSTFDLGLAQFVPALLPVYAKDVLGIDAWGLGLLRAAPAVGGAADMVSIVIRQTLVQLETPDAMRRRVSAVNSVFIGASNQLGEVRAGAMASVIAPFGAVVAGGFGTIAVAALWVRLFPALARRDRLVPGA